MDISRGKDGRYSVSFISSMGRQCVADGETENEAKENAFYMQIEHDRECETYERQMSGLSYENSLDYECEDLG